MTNLKQPIVPKRLTLATLCCPLRRAAIDQAMLAYFPGPASFTGENVLEIHCHGGLAVTRKLLQALSSLPGFRLAERGEFAKRAFLNGKLDLLQAEGLADLIDAETECQRAFAYSQLAGKFTQRYQAWTTAISSALAALEAYIDFGEDEGIPQALLAETAAQVAGCLAEIELHLAGRHSELLKKGLQVAIVGAPNAGKSSLINWICNRQVSIVSPTPGTTRDVTSCSLEVEGFPVTLYDTAGIRNSGRVGSIEQEGILLSRGMTKKADFLLYLLDCSKPKDFQLAQCDASSLAIVCTKSDKKASVAFSSVLVSLKQQFPAAPVLQVSSTKQEGLESLLSVISTHIKQAFAEPSGGILLLNERHRACLSDCQEALAAFAKWNEQSCDMAMITEHLRVALKALAKITGKVGVEDILGMIFSRFCIGK